MDATDNPWAEMLARPQGKSTTNIFIYCARQGEMLSEATEGKIVGVFAKTSEVNNLISTSIDFSTPMRILADAPYLHRAPQVDLCDASKMYEKQDYCSKSGRRSTDSGCSRWCLGRSILRPCMLTAAYARIWPNPTVGFRLTRTGSHVPFPLRTMAISTRFFERFCVARS